VHTDFLLTENPRLALANHNWRTVTRNERRGLWSPGSLLFLLLCFSVFSWGTSYKLSLYKNNPAGSATPAKLCKLTSDNAKSELDHVLDGHRVLAAVFLIDLAPMSGELAFAIFGQVILHDARCNLAPLRFAPVLHLRPPPNGSHRLLR
jgi:hypothetical protein